MGSSDDLKLYDGVYRLVRRLISPIVAQRLGFSGEAIPGGMGPRLVLCNHNTDYDFLLLALMSKEPMDFVATESILRMGLIPRLVAKKARLILHDKGSKGVGTLKSITKRIKAGRSVMLFPEGNRSFDGRTGRLSPAVGKIVKMTGAAIVIYRITGGYLTTPRWGHGIRRGKMMGTVARVLSPKEVSEMSAKELQSLIEKELYTDAYEEQERSRIAYKSRKRGEYLETLLFACPSCKRVGTLSSRKSALGCTCGFRLVLDEFGYLKDKDGRQCTITEAFSQQKRLLADMLQRSPDEPLWQDEVTMLRLGMGHSELEEKRCRLTCYREQLMIGDEELGYSDIQSIDIVQRNRLSIHMAGESWHYEFTGSRTFNAVKYLCWFERSFA
jgi:1-acyl-sn-glycerol-3-phosphate acyltransferase